MAAKLFSLLTSSDSSRQQRKYRISAKSLGSPKKWSTLPSTTSPVLPPPKPAPSRAPPPRPPRPETSLLDLRPTIVLSPLAVVPPCVLHLPSPNNSGRSFRFSDEVFESLSDHLKFTSTTPETIKPTRGDTPGFSYPTSRHALQRSAARSKEGFDFSAFVHVSQMNLSVTTRDFARTDPDTTDLEVCKSIRAVDSFEYAILQSHMETNQGTRPAKPPFSTPSTSPTKTITLDSSSFGASTDPGAWSAVDPESPFEEHCYSSFEMETRHPLLKRWRSFYQKHRRPLLILATVSCVLVAATAIAGPVIWKLTTCR